MMSRRCWQLAVVAALVLAVAAVLLMRPRPGKTPAPGGSPTGLAQPPQAPAAPGRTVLPRLLEVGSNRCMACQRMAVVLDELRKEFGGVLDVGFIDVFEQPGEAERYQVSIIPTQILYGRRGEEIFRHTGFYSKEEIVGKFKELGIDL